MKKILSVLIISCFMTMIAVRGVFATPIKVQYNISEAMKKINEETKKDPQLAMRSNPYDYIKNNEYYDELVGLGSKAIPSILEDINKSENNGLREYILAIAVEDITNLNLKKNKDYKDTWSNAKGFTKSFDKHLQEVPKKVKEIANSSKNATDKKRELVDLGTPAIPYIMTEIENGNNEIAESLDELMIGSYDKELNSSLLKGENKNYKEFIKQNKNKFNDLRVLVEDRIK